MKVVKRIMTNDVIDLTIGNKFFKNRFDLKCPYSMNPTRIVVHNTANDARARNEIVYMTTSPKETSFHYAVDDSEIVQGIEEDRNGWHASDGGNGKGNREGIGIEICYSKSGGNKFIKAEQNAVLLIVDILKKYGWGIDRVTKHQDYTNKYCPHRTLDMGWERFLNMIIEKMNSSIPQLTIEPIPNKKITLNIDATLWDLSFNTYAEAKTVKQFKKGDVVEVVGIVKHPIGTSYYVLDNTLRGFNIYDVSDYVQPIKEKIESIEEKKPIVPSKLSFKEKFIKFIKKIFKWKI